MYIRLYIQSHSEPKGLKPPCQFVTNIDEQLQCGTESVVLETLSVLRSSKNRQLQARVKLLLFQSIMHKFGATSKSFVNETSYRRDYQAINNIVRSTGGLSADTATVTMKFLLRVRDSCSKYVTLTRERPVTVRQQTSKAAKYQLAGQVWLQRGSRKGQHRIQSNDCKARHLNTRGTALVCTLTKG